MYYLSKQEIEKNFDIKDAIEAVKMAFSFLEKGKIDSPLRTSIKTKEGTLLFMPAYCKDLGLAVMKNVNVYPENYKKEFLTTPSTIMLIDANNGYVLAFLDGTYVTQLRTGAASGAAFDILAKKECRKGALIGTGGQAEAQLTAMLAARDLQEISVFSRSKEKRLAFIEKANKKFKNVSIVEADSGNDCVKDADLIITVTTSSVPVFDGSFVKKGATISCVGNYEPNKQEIDPVLLKTADKIFCDHKEAVLSEAGDILIPLKQSLISAKDINSIGDVINGDLIGRESDEEIIVFKTVGVAAQDLIASAMIYRKINNV